MVSLGTQASGGEIIVMTYFIISFLIAQDFNQNTNKKKIVKMYS